MTDRDSTVTQEELQRLCRRRDRGRPAAAPSRRGAGHPEDAPASPNGGRRPRPSTRATARSPRSRSRALFELDQLTRSTRHMAGGGRRRVLAAFLVARSSAGWRTVHRRRRRAASTSIRRRRSMPTKVYVVEVRHRSRSPAPSGRIWCNAVEAPRLRAASAAARAERIEAGRRPPAAGPVRPRRLLSCTRDRRRAFHHLYARTDAPQTAMPIARESVSAFYWVDQSVAYIVSGGRPRAAACSRAAA